MNNHAKNVGVPSLFGHSGATPQPQHSNPLSQQWNHTTNLFSRSHPQTHFPGHFQLSETQSQVLAQAQYAQAQAQLLSQATHAHIQSQTQPVVHFHSANTNASNVSSTPTIGSAKRTTQKHPSRPSSSSNTNQSSLPDKTMDLTLAAQQKKREFPEKVAPILPESALYTKLLDFEAQVDAAFARRMIDIQEAIRCPPHVQKTLRIYVFNTFSNHTKIDSEKKNVEESSWSLKITGRILEDGQDPVCGILQRSSPSYPKFSAFFRKITIFLDQSLYPDNHVIVWDSARSPNQQDGFEVKRKGDREFTAMIRIEMNYSPEKFMVSTQLSNLLGVEVETCPRIIAALWHYVKSRKLQCPDDPSFFMCDPSLQRVFGEEKMRFTMAAQKVLQHLSQPQPIHLEHNIKLSGFSPAETACYDVQVDVPVPLEKEISTLLASNSIESHREIEAYDEAICTSLKKIQEHHRRRAFFLSFSQSPAEFIDTLIASQSKDLRHVAGDTNQSAGKDLLSEFYNQPWVEDAVIRYLNRKTAGSDARRGS